MKKVILFFVALLISLTVFLIPIPNLSKGGLFTLFIFVFASILWMSEIIPLYVTSFVILLLEALFLPHYLSGVSYKHFFYPFFSPVIVLFLGGFTISKGLHKYYLDKAITLKVVTSVKGKPKTLILSFMLVTAFLSMWMSNTAATALMVGVVIPVLERVEDINYNIALLLAIAFGANIGGMGTPVGTPPNAIAIGILNSHNVQIPFLEWMKVAMPISLILLATTFIIIILLFPSKVKDVPYELFVKEEKETESFTKKFKISKWSVVVVSLLTILFWLLSEWIKVSSSIIAILPIIVFFGFKILDVNDFSSLGWDVLILMGGGLSLSKAIEVSGLSKWIVNVLGLNSVSQLYVLIGFMAITIFLTNFISNTTTAALILPLAITVFKNPILSGYAIALSASISMLLPVSTPPNAIVYNTRKIPLFAMIKAGIVVIIVSALILFTGLHISLSLG